MLALHVAPLRGQHVTGHTHQHYYLLHSHQVFFNLPFPLIPRITMLAIVFITDGEAFTGPNHLRYIQTLNSTWCNIFQLLKNIGWGDLLDWCHKSNKSKLNQVNQAQKNVCIQKCFSNNYFTYWNMCIYYHTVRMFLFTLLTLWKIYCSYDIIIEWHGLWSL